MDRDVAPGWSETVAWAREAVNDLAIIAELRGRPRTPPAAVDMRADGTYRTGLDIPEV